MARNRAAVRGPGVRDAAAAKVRRPAQRGGTLVGMFIGLILGLALAAGTAYFLSKGGALSGSPGGPGKDAVKAAGRADAGNAPGDRGRFDFYRILPGHEEPRIRPPDVKPIDRAEREKSATRTEVVMRTEAVARPDGKTSARAEPAGRDAKADPARASAQASKDDARTDPKVDSGKSGAVQAGAQKVDAGVGDATRPDVSRGAVAVRADSRPEVAPRAETAGRAAAGSVSTALLTTEAAARAEAQRRVPSERFFLQAGAFPSAADAENQKARLALSGWQASVQPATLPDQSTWYRVRVGPFDNADDMNRNRAELGRRGFDTSVIRNP